MNDRPLAAAAGCWLFGASVPSLFAGTMQAAAIAGAILLLAGLGLAGRLAGRLAIVCAASVLLAFGERIAVDHSNASDLSVLWKDGNIPGHAEISGRIASLPEVDGDSVAFQFAAKQVRADSAAEAVRIRETVRVRIRLREHEEQSVAASWKRGDGLTVAGTPERPAEAGNFDAFDYREYLERQGIRWQWAVDGTSGIRPTDAAVPWHMRLLRAVDELRSAISRLMDRLYPHGDAGYMKGLVAGIVDEVDPVLYDAYSRLGLTHILAISGLHVGVVVFVLLRLGAGLRLTRERSLDLAFVFMPLYMLVTGASPSAVRACLMAMAALALARRNRLKDGIHLLSAAALIMAIWDPRIVENVSFQLSFAVTAGLLLWTPAVSDLLSFVRWKSLRSALAVTATAQAVSLPLTVYYFHSVHLLSLPANLVLVPLVSFAVLPLGMASVVLGAVWLPLGMAPAWLATACNRLTFGLVDGLNPWIELMLIWPQPSKLWVAAAYGLIGVTLSALRRRGGNLVPTGAAGFEEEEATTPLQESDTLPLSSPPGKKPFVRPSGNPVAAGLSAIRAPFGKAALVLLWAAWWLWGYQPAFLNADAFVQFLDVGQGDGILIRTGKGKHVLVDAGGTVSFRKAGEEWRQRRDPYEIGKDLLVPLLKQRGVRKLDALVLTHLDADHIGGAEAVVRSMRVGAIIWNGTWKDSADAERLFRAAESRGIPVYAAGYGKRWDVDATASLDFLHPHGTPEAGAMLPYSERQNESSVVALLTVYGRRFLLTGDVELAGETEILRRLADEKAADGRLAGLLSSPIDVMKAAHHGSKTSTGSAWLAEWQPAEVVVSVGGRNLYGHPHSSVMARIEESGAAAWRTDRNGEIQYRVKPGGILQRTMKRGSQ